MLSISLGPVALPVAPLVLLAAVWLGSWTATKALARRGTGAGPGAASEGRPREDAIGNAFFVAAGVGLLAARAMHVGLNAGAYAAEPLAMLDLRDGGWHAPAGALAGAAWLAWRGWRTPAWRRPLATAALAALLVWTAGTALLGARGGAVAPALVLTTLEDGRPTDLRQAAAGRPAVVNLWASWCAPCRQEMPALAAAQQREPAIAFVFVNQGETPAAVQRYLASLGQQLRTVLLDPRAALGPAVRSAGLPTTLFYDAEGRLVDAHFGVLNTPALESRLRQLRAAR